MTDRPRQDPITILLYDPRRPDAFGQQRHHLHVFEDASDRWPRLPAFRDHLRTHPDDAAAYARLKHTLAAADAHDRPRYRAGKAPFIERLS
ncbi:GrpB family protein [Actinoplanes sp. M2I2]|uniref:GrpB family protein n=1 Tax=Actinoplanes sp. M2I2 TaxID=1734444 RepID=UPI0020215923|nr:GrpB family protein [Actinoplanes sp. M2I2]